MRYISFIAATCSALVLAATVQASTDGERGGAVARHPSPSPTGHEVVFEADFDGPPTLWIASIDGKSLCRLMADPAEARTPAWSPDGRTVAFMSARGLMSISPEGTNLRPLGAGAEPAWSPDSARIAFSHDTDIWVMNADGTDRRRITPTTKTEKPQAPDAGQSTYRHPGFSPAGDRLVFWRDDPGASGNLMVINRDGSGLRALTSGLHRDWNPQWSAFGILFSSDRDRASGHFQPWLVQPDGRGLHKVSDAPSLDPVFLRSGLLVFGDEIVNVGLSQISVMDPRSGIKRPVTTFDAKDRGLLAGLEHRWGACR